MILAVHSIHDGGYRHAKLFGEFSHEPSFIAKLPQLSNLAARKFYKMSAALFLIVKDRKVLPPYASCNVSDMTGGQAEFLGKVGMPLPKRISASNLHDVFVFYPCGHMLLASRLVSKSHVEHVLDVFLGRNPLKVWQSVVQFVPILVIALMGWGCGRPNKSLKQQPMQHARLHYSVQTQTDRFVSCGGRPRLYQASCGAALTTREPPNQAVTGNIVNPRIAYYGLPSLFHAYSYLRYGQAPQTYTKE